MKLFGKQIGGSFLLVSIALHLLFGVILAPSGLA